MHLEKEATVTQKKKKVLIPVVWRRDFPPRPELAQWSLAREDQMEV